MLFMSQIPLLRTMTKTYTSSPIWQFSEKLFEAIRSHFFSTLIVLEPSYSYFLPFISRHVSFAVILKSASSHGVGVFSVKLKGFKASSLRTLVFIYSVFPLSNSTPAVSVVSTISLASASPLFFTFIDTSILLSPVDLESYVSLLVPIFCLEFLSILSDCFIIWIYFLGTNLYLVIIYNFHSFRQRRSL